MCIRELNINWVTYFVLLWSWMHARMHAKPNTHSHIHTQTLLRNGRVSIETRAIERVSLFSCLHNLLILMILITSVVRPWSGPLCTICQFIVSHNFIWILTLSPSIFHRKLYQLNVWLYRGLTWLENHYPDTDHCRMSFRYYVISHSLIRNCRRFGLFEVLLLAFIVIHTTALAAAAITAAGAAVCACIVIGLFSPFFFPLLCIFCVFVLSRFMFTVWYWI